MQIEKTQSQIHIVTEIYSDTDTGTDKQTRTNAGTSLCVREPMGIATLLLGGGLHTQW